MRVAVVVAAFAVVLSGCVVGPGQEDRVVFRAAGSFDAALAAGADVLGAREDPGVPGNLYAAIPMQVAELDAAWAAGRYALTSVHWWGPQGPPAPRDDGIVEMPAGWQGFMLMPEQMQVIPGSESATEVRRLGDEFLRAVTTLDQTGRTAALDDLLAACDVIACVAPLPDGVDAAKAWRDAGGLAGVDRDQLSPMYGQQGMASWWFNFAFDTATLEEGRGEGSTRTVVGSNDIVEFSWSSAQQHSDAASYDRLEETLQRHGMPVPAAADLAWTHQEIQGD